MNGTTRILYEHETKIKLERVFQEKKCSFEKFVTIFGPRNLSKTGKQLKLWHHNEVSQLRYFKNEKTKKTLQTVVSNNFQMFWIFCWNLHKCSHILTIVFLQFFSMLNKTVKARVCYIAKLENKQKLVSALQRTRVHSSRYRQFVKTRKCPLFWWM